MVLKKGYKQTEVGVIPEDWKAILLDDVTKRGSGHTPSKQHPSYYDGDIVWVSLADTKMLDKGLISDSSIKISPLGIKNSSAVLHPKGTVIISRDAGIGKSAIAGCDLCVSQHFIAWQCKPPLLSNWFLYYLLQFKKSDFERIAIGSTIKTIGLPFFKSYKIPLPRFHEQEAIATALNDADALIQNLEQLIAKKQLIKQGAMQELLTPKEGWEEKSLGSISDIYTGSRNNQDKVEDGLYPFFVRSLYVEKINSYSYNGEAILVPGEGNIGNIFHYINGKFDFHQRVYKISDFNSGYSGKYIYWYMYMYFGKHAMQNSVKATVDSLRLPTFMDFDISFPPTKDEQTRIANILSAMDEEIEALEQKLEKYRQIKQGMMQDLLTGKVRLV